MFKLIEHAFIAILKEAYLGLEAYCKEAEIEMPKNIGDNRKLDCAVIRYVHETRKRKGERLLTQSDVPLQKDIFYMKAQIFLPVYTLKFAY